MKKLLKLATCIFASLLIISCSKGGNSSSDDIESDLGQSNEVVENLPTEVDDDGDEEFDGLAILAALDGMASVGGEPELVYPPGTRPDPNLPYAGNWIAPTFEEAKKTHMVGKIPETRFFGKEAWEVDGAAEEKFFELQAKYAKEGFPYSEPTFMALNQLLNEGMISGYKWNYNELNIYYNSGAIFGILYDSDQKRDFTSVGEVE